MLASYTVPWTRSQWPEELVFSFNMAPMPESPLPAEDPPHRRTCLSEECP